MLRNHWPEEDVYLSSVGGQDELRVAQASREGVKSLGQMGGQASQNLPFLQMLLSQERSLLEPEEVALQQNTN